MTGSQPAAAGIGTRVTDKPWRVEPSQVVTRFIAERYDRPSKVSEIAATIALEIITGAYAPGAEINSVSIARRFGASRTPVREAFLLLEKETLVELPPRRRPCVPVLSAQDIEDNYRLRIELLSLMTQEISARASDGEITSLEPFLKRMILASEAGSSDDYFWTNVAYYERALFIANNQVLKRTLDTLLLGSMRLRRLGLSLPGRVKRSAAAHIEITRALAARDAVLASALMRSNLLAALKAITDQPAFA